MLPKAYKMTSQLQHHQALPLSASDPAMAKVIKSQLILNKLLDQQGIDLLASQLGDRPIGIQAQILEVWYDWREAVQDAKEQISGNAASWTWLHCHLAKLERKRDLAVKEILRQHYLDIVQLYALAKVPGAPDDAAALELRQEIGRLERLVA